MTTTTEESSPHILMIPFPAQGHLLPLLDLARHLTTIHASITFTVVTTPKNLPLLATATCPSIQPLVLALPVGEDIHEFPTSASVAYVIHSLSLLSPQILTWAHSVPNPPTAVISDVFLGWTVDLARELSVPRVNFCCASALYISVLSSLFADDTLTLPPPLPSFPYNHLSSMFRDCEANAGVPIWDFFRTCIVSNARSYATIINSFDALERDYFDHLKKTCGHDRVYAVGPTALRGELSTPRLPRDISDWLDGAPVGSVVYVCFGSRVRLGGDQARALARALELSGVRFVWAGQAERLPEGVGGRGRVIEGWAPQKEILGHAAVGAFVTHCGWNAVLEGIAAGVVLLAWPMDADQFVHAKLLVEEQKVALRACVGGPDAVPEEKELARVIAEAVDAGKHVRVKAKAEEMRRVAMEAVEEGGSSYGDILKLIALLVTE